MADIVDEYQTIEKMKTNQLIFTTLTTLLAVSLLAGCRAVAPLPAAPPQEAPASATVSEALKNATFGGILPDQPITLADGIAYYEEDGPGTPFVQLIDQLTAPGDLDGDGVLDPVGLLVDYTIGSADFVYLAALLSTQSGPAEAVLIGDRTPVKALTVADGQVIVDFVGPGPSDAACCPAWNVRKVYGVADGRLVERSSEQLSEVTLADLAGTAWRLVELGADHPVLPETEITLRFADGQLSGSAGCNDYAGAVTAPEELPQSFAAGPIPVTARLCPEPVASQETTYLDLLGKTVAWHYAFGQLALTYKLEGDVFGELLFAPQPAEAGALPRFEPQVECFAQPPDDLAVEFDIDCGYVVVPEFHRGASSRELKLGVTRLNSGQGTAAAPLFMLAGGPGQTHISPDLYRLLQPELLGGILAARDIVILEQRGTQYTDTFLDCPAMSTATWDAYTQGLRGEEAAAFGATVLQACIDDFKVQGVDFDAYNSVENAADVNAVREALGYDKIMYYGASYGAQLGQHVMRDFPDILEAVVLDGAEGLSRKSWVENRALDAQWGIDNLTALCAADAKCAAAYDIPALVDAALALFDAGPLPYTYTDPTDPTLTITGEVTVDDMVGLIYGQQGDRIGAMSLPAILAQLTAGGSELVAETLGGIKASNLLASRTATKSPMAMLMHMAMVCSDDPVKAVDEVKLDGVGRYATLFGQAGAAEYVQLCSLIDVAELPDATDVDVTTNVPTLLLGGDLDVATPTFRSQEVADALPNATLVVFPGRTHVQIAGVNTCAAQVMTQFVLDPTAPLDTSCTAESPLLGFVLPDGTMSREADQP